MSQWENLKTSFNEKLPRRTAVLVKENTQTTSFYYPLDFGKIGYQLDTRESSGYEEAPNLSFYLDEWVLGNLVNESKWQRQSFFFTEMQCAPNWIQRRAAWINSGLELAESLSSPFDHGVHWNLVFRQRSLHYPIRRTFMLIIKSDHELIAASKIKDQKRIITLETIDGIKLFICLTDDTVYGVYENESDYRLDPSWETASTSPKKGRYIAIPVELSFPPVSCSSHQLETSISLSMSTLGAKEAYMNHVPDAELLTEKCWNTYFNRIPPLPSGNPDLEAAYYKCWYVIRQNYYHHPKWGKIILEALPVYKGIWTWGTSALPHSALQNPDEGPAMMKNALDALMKQIREDGYIPHAIYIDEKRPGSKWSDGTGIIQTPHLPWVALAYYRKTKDRSALERWYSPLVRYYQYICKTRDEELENLHLWAALTSFDTGLDVWPAFSDITYGTERYVYPAVFAAERCEYEKSMAEISQLLHMEEEALRWRREMEKTLSAADLHLWDDAKAWYGVRHESGQLETIIGVDGLFFLSYHLVTDMKAGRMTEHVRGLIGPYGVYTVSPSEEKYEADVYWRGPVWSKSCALAAHAVSRYYPELSNSLKDSIRSFIFKYPSIWECMNGENGQIARGDIGVLATPFISSNVGAGELIGALLALAKN